MEMWRPILLCLQPLSPLRFHRHCLRRQLLRFQSRQRLQIIGGKCANLALNATALASRTKTGKSNEQPFSLYSLQKNYFLLLNERIVCRYFQCVTNPRCDHCWINLTATTTTTTRPLPFTSVTPVTNFLRTDYQTLLPGTYTSSSSGTAHVVIVQQPSQSISISVVTATMTNLVTISVIPFCGASFGGSTATASPSVDFQPGVEWKR